MESDDALLQAWRAGDRNAGQQLIERHFDAVCRFFRSKVGDDVDDLIQRTFLDCLERTQEIRTPTFRSYLFAVARNRLFDHLRRGFRRPVDALGSRSITDLQTRASGAIAKAQAKELVTRALQALPVDFQITLELAYWEELSGAEISAALGVSEHTVRSRLSRGRKMLRAHVERLAEAPVEAEQTLKHLERQIKAP